MNQDHSHTATEPPSIPLQEIYAELNPSICQACYYRAAPDFRYVPPKQTFKFIYLWYVVGGVGHVKKDGQWIRLARGDFFVLHPGEHYQEETAYADDPSRIYCFFVNLFGRDLPRMTSILKRHLPSRFPCSEMAKAERVCAELMDEQMGDTGRHAIRKKILVLEFLELIFTSLETTATLAERRHRALIQRAEEFITQHVSDPITPDDIATHVDISPSHLFTVFRQCVGCSPIRYQTDLRLRAARRMLLDGKSVTATASAVGFSSLHYFSRLFKKAHGVTPTHFVRKMSRK